MKNLAGRFEFRLLVLGVIILLATVIAIKNPSTTENVAPIIVYIWIAGIGCFLKGVLLICIGFQKFGVGIAVIGAATIQFSLLTGLISFFV